MKLREWLSKRQIVIRPINFGLHKLNLNPRQVEMSPANPLFFVASIRAIEDFFTSHI